MSAHSEVVIESLAQGSALGLRDFGVAITGYIDQVKQLIYSIKIEESGLARARANAGNGSPPEHGIDQGGLADIAPPEKHDFGQGISGHMR